MNELTHNDGKNEIIEVDGVSYNRHPIKTHVVTDKDQINDVCQQYAAPLLQDGDVLFISKILSLHPKACNLYERHSSPPFGSDFLPRYVTKTPHGIGLGIPETMEMALRECGTIRILFAAFISVIGKIFGKRGWFGWLQVRRLPPLTVPVPTRTPPYNECVVLGPLNPDETAADIAKHIGHPTIIVTSTIWAAISSVLLMHRQIVIFMHVF